jgi:hypothetical protein
MERRGGGGFGLDCCGCGSSLYLSGGGEGDIGLESRAGFLFGIGGGAGFLAICCERLDSAGGGCSWRVGKAGRECVDALEGVRERFVERWSRLRSLAPSRLDIGFEVGLEDVGELAL